MPSAEGSSRDILARPMTPNAPPDGNAPPRLIAVVVGIDEYSSQDGSREFDLRCSVNDAVTLAGTLRQTQPQDALDLVLLTSPVCEGSQMLPTRATIIQALQRAASMAGRDDTVAFYFAGHGGMLGGRPSLFPLGIRLAVGAAHVHSTDVLDVGELQALFADSSCPRRVMFLDCCQSCFTGGPDSGTEQPPPGVMGRGLQWRTGAPVSEGLLNALRILPHGWSVLLACGPNELSLEDPEVGEHGIFSHFLAEGLRGEADLDGDGIVSLAELAQYLGRRVSGQARAVIEVEAVNEIETVRDEADSTQQRGRQEVRQLCQTPTLFWAGPMEFPLTRMIATGRRSFQRGVFALTRRYVFGEIPYALAQENMMRYGTAVLFGIAMSLCLLRFLPFPWSTESIVLVVGVGTVTASLWLFVVALAAAAAEMKWHSGGYATATLIAVWHLAVLGIGIGVAASMETGQATTTITDVVPFALSLAVLLSLVIIFGCNVVQSVLALAELVKKDDRISLRSAFLHLRQRWVQAHIDNCIAMVSAHPIVYQLLALILCGMILAHAVYVWSFVPMNAGAVVSLGRDMVLILFVLWQSQWYPAAYNYLSRTVLPDH